MRSIIDVIGSYRQTFTTGLMTTIVAGTATAGHILALRAATAGKAVRFRSFEIDAMVMTAFGAAQEWGFDLFVARTYSVAHSGATALSITGDNGKKRTTQYPTTALTGRIAGTGALTAGTHTLDGDAVARTGYWASAQGLQLNRYWDFLSVDEPSGIICAASEGLVGRNTILMGATGVVKAHFTVEWDDVILGN